MVPHRGASGRAISVYSTPWPPTCSGVLPSWCTIEVAALLVFTEEAAIHDAPGPPKPYVHLPAQRKALGSLSGSGGLTAVV